MTWNSDKSHFPNRLLFRFQSFFELTNEQPTTVPCQAGFVAPLPSFQFEPQQQQQHHMQPQHHQQPPHQHHQQQQQSNTNQPYSQLTLQQTHAISQLESLHQPVQIINQAISNHEENSYDSYASGSSNSNSSWTSPAQTLADDSGPNNSSSKYLIAHANTQSELKSDINVSKSEIMITAPTPTRKRNMGGRRARNAPNLTPAEEEKRKVRRERNKLAAARCRKRRVDQTNELTDKVNLLEKEKHKLQIEFQELQATKEELELYLHDHRPQCLLLNGAAINIKPEFKLPQVTQPQHMTLAIPSPMMLNKIKEEPIDSSSLDADEPPSAKRMLLSSLNPIVASSGGCDTPTSLNTPNILPLSANGSRPNRPSSLAVPISMTPSQCKNITDMAGISISTPSNGVMFNFDSLMDGGTGLTPVSQPLMPNYPMLNHRNPLDLATPTTEPSKLVSL